MRPETKKLLDQLVNGPPRARYHAVKQLKFSAESIEAPLTALLICTSDDDVRIKILDILGDSRIKSAETVDAIVRQFSSKNDLVRSTAAFTLLHASPKLKRHLPQLRAIAGRDSSTSVRHTLLRVLERYPK